MALLTVIRRWHFHDEMPIRKIERRTGLLRITVAASAGARIALSSRASAATPYSYEQSAARALADRQSIGLGVGVALGRKLQLGLQGEAGLSQGAPDVKLGLRLGAGF